MCVDLPHLRYAVAAAEHRSFRRAAAALNIAQPTLSKRIRELEQRLGIHLFERSTGGVQVTSNGEEFLILAKRVLADLDGMESYAKASRAGKAGRLQIGFYTALAGSLGDTVASFGRRHPQLDLNIVEDDRTTLIALLDRGSIDVALVLGEPAHREYAHMSLWSERIMVVFHKMHPFAQRDFVYWTDLKSERFVMSSRDPGPEITGVLLSKLGLPGEWPLIKRLSAHHSAMIGVVDSGCGITLACESSSLPQWPSVVFREVRDGNGATRFGFVAYWRRNNDSPILKQFLAWLCAHPAVPTVHINALLGEGPES